MIAHTPFQASKCTFSISILKTILSKLLLFSPFVRRSTRLFWEETWNADL